MGLSFCIFKKGGWLLALCWLLAWPLGARANVWMDENFDDGAAFNAEDLDTYHVNNLTANVTVTATGALSSAQAFSGTQSYLLTAGQSISIPAHPDIANNQFSYSDPANGNFQYWQFAMRLGQIPAAGQMAIFRWGITAGDDATPYHIYMKLVSDGSQVEVVVGEDAVLNIEKTIGIFTDTGTWTFLTVQVQKGEALADDMNGTGNTGRPDQQDVPNSVRFYLSSAQPLFSFSLPGTTTLVKNYGLEWSFECSAGSLYLDDMYWEGGMDGDEGANDNLRPFTSGTPLTAPVTRTRNSWVVFN